MLESRDADAPVAANLSAGDAFDILDVTGGMAWGVAIGSGLVGYLPAAVLGIAE